ncbi:MAG: hypothetical protein AB2A00_06975 [Myxococcota bacterium]
MRLHATLRLRRPALPLCLGALSLLACEKPRDAAPPVATAPAAPVGPASVPAGGDQPTSMPAEVQARTAFVATDGGKALDPEIAELLKTTPPPANPDKVHTAADGVGGMQLQIITFKPLDLHFTIPSNWEVAETKDAYYLRAPQSHKLAGTAVKVQAVKAGAGENAQVLAKRVEEDSRKRKDLEVERVGTPTLAEGLKAHVVQVAQKDKDGKAVLRRVGVFVDRPEKIITLTYEVPMEKADAASFTWAGILNSMVFITEEDARRINEKQQRIAEAVKANNPTDSHPKLDPGAHADGPHSQPSSGGPASQPGPGH